MKTHLDASGNTVPTPTEQPALDSLAPLPAPPSAKPKRPPLLLPPALIRPGILLWVWILPQSLLLALNFSAWDLVAGEADRSHSRIALVILLGELSLLLGGIAYASVLRLRKKTVQRLHGTILLVLPASFLGWIFFHGASAIPGNIDQWMLPRDAWLTKQFALLMPAVLYGAFRLLCPDREEPVRSDALIIVSALLLPCAAFWIGLQAIDGNSFPSQLAVSHMVRTAMVTALIIFASSLTALVLRGCVSAYVSARRGSVVTLAMLTFLVTIVAPLTGLLLNTGISFPADFQIPWIYAVVVVNGLVLMLPNFSNPVAHRLVWLAQCALFPFTAYFFAVFLPILPLMPLALLMVGLGALMMVPSALFLLHGYKLLDGFHAEIRDGSKWTPAILGAAAILAWPIGYTVKARLDRSSLHQALDFQQYPDYSANAHFTGNLSALRQGLHNLRDFKNGSYLPYLSEFYNWLAFDNLVLPQKKIDSLYQTFFGEPLPRSTAKAATSILDVTRRGPTASEALEGPVGTRPSADAILESLTTSTSASGGTTRLLATIITRNPTADPTEFYSAIRIPPAAMISGLWLTIGTERVPGRIFEKRAAEWVYQKITEVRPVPQDPAILRYTGIDTADLRVFPVDGKATRKVEVEFLYPDGHAPAITIGDRPLITGSETVPSPILSAHSDAAWRIMIPESATSALPTVRREPYLHFLVDWSRGSSLAEPSNLLHVLRNAAAAFPAVREVKLTFVNFETRDFRNGALFPLSELDSQSFPRSLRDALPVRGGFEPLPAMKEVLFRHHKELQQPDSSALRRFPQIVVLSGESPAVTDADPLSLAWFASLVPDLSTYWKMGASQSTPTPAPLQPSETAGMSLPSPVRIYEIGTTRFAAPADGSVTFTNFADSSPPQGVLRVYSPATGAFSDVEKTNFLPAATPYSAAVPVWSEELSRIFTPRTAGKASLDKLVQLSRETGILAPSVSYIVVENSAQWKMLERAEKKTLKGHEALALTDTAVTPEPGTVTLLILAVVTLILWSQRTRLRTLRRTGS